MMMTGKNFDEMDSKDTDGFVVRWERRLGKRVREEISTNCKEKGEKQDEGRETENQNKPKIGGGSVGRGDDMMVTGGAEERRRDRGGGGETIKDVRNP
jgi:hypothetical protein